MRRPDVPPNSVSAEPDEAGGVLAVVQRYARTFRLLLEYDEDRLAPAPTRPTAPAEVPTLADARAAVAALRDAVVAGGGPGALFGQERGDGLAGLLGALRQTFGGQPLYPTAEARAAHLLYFVVKDHPFSDGNKRIGTLLFLESLRQSGRLTRKDGGLRFADNAMVALTLLVAESKPAQKDLMIRLVLSLLADESA